jgi:hypothetical protein
MPRHFGFGRSPDAKGRLTPYAKGHTFIMLGEFVAGHGKIGGNHGGYVTLPGTFIPQSGRKTTAAGRGPVFSGTGKG